MYKNYRLNDIEIGLSNIGARPLDLMVTGVTGAGKSTTLNSFFQKTISSVGSGVDPETMVISSHSLNDSFRLWDTPGLGDGVARDESHSKKITNLLYKSYKSDERSHGFIDLVLIIIEGSNRDMGTTYRLINEIVVPNFQKERILVAINQADMAMKGRHWNYSLNKPEAKLTEFLEAQSTSIKNRVKEATGVDIIKPIYYSAEYNYNIDKLFDLIINNMPRSKRELKI